MISEARRMGVFKMILKDLRGFCCLYNVRHFKLWCLISCWWESHTVRLRDIWFQATSQALIIFLAHKLNCVLNKTLGLWLFHFNRLINKALILRFPVFTQRLWILALRLLIEYFWAKCLLKLMSWIKTCFITHLSHKLAFLWVCMAFTQVTSCLRGPFNMTEINPTLTLKMTGRIPLWL